MGTGSRATLASWILRASMLGLALASAVGCAEPVPGDERVAATTKLDSQPSIFGGLEDDGAGALAGVVALKVATEGGFELCSGALIAPNVVLTARHCVAKSITTSVSCDENGRSANGKHVDGDRDPRSVAVYVGAKPKLGGTPASVGRAIVSPQADHLCDTDIALVVLETPIHDVAPLAVRLSARVGRGETIRSVGYGQNDRNDDRTPLGTRLRKENVSVLATGKGVSAFNTALGAHEFEVGRSICQGDSGGPAISEQTGAVIGVVSRGGECDEDFGHIYTTTAGYAVLFDEAFKLAGGAALLEDPSTTGPRSDLDAVDPSVTDAPEGSSSCSASGRTAPLGARTGAPLAIAFAIAAALRLRSRRQA